MSEKDLEDRLADISPENGEQRSYFPRMYTRLTHFVHDHKDGIRKYLVDTSASMTFFMPLSATIEHYAAHIDGDHTVRTREGSFVAQLLLGRPYGMFRDWWKKRWNVTESSHWFRKHAVDSSARVLYGVVVYPFVLGAAGVPFEQAKKAYVIGLSVSVIAGVPYGSFLDWWRKRWHVRSTPKD